MTEDDFWQDEEFEDAVARGIIAFFESRVAKNRGSCPPDRLKTDDLEFARNYGFYCPGKARSIFGEGFDTTNDPLPIAGTLLLPGDIGKNSKTSYGGYSHILSIKQIRAFPHGIEREGPGTPYQLVTMFPNADGRVHGERRYFTIAKDGKIAACGRRYVQQSRFGRQVVIRQFDEEPHIEKDAIWQATFTTQFLADERFSWRIEAVEKQARVRLGCEREEVKSLLYARELPLTATGRKRPILHLVAAHRRRLKSGVEIDIDEFLRGTREVVMDGTMFRVHPPAVMSQQRAHTASVGQK